jgi:UDP-GlcNAc:undecaprenyl-phosphate GlcNAc-1-phosphate transferase
MIYAAQGGNLVVCGLLCALMGAILGFLPYNFSPAKVFMGDAGSLFLGYMLAVVSVCGTYYSESQSMLSIVVPVIVLAIPVFDTCSVMAIRLKNKKPLMEGDKNHFSHRLVKLGMTKREAVLSIYILCLTTGIVALMLRSLNDAESVLILFHIFGVFVFIALLEIASRRDNNNGN